MRSVCLFWRKHGTKSMENDCIKVSVVIPVYNVQQYLKRSMDSAISQSLREIEILCVDDCSTDASLSILEKYAENDDRIRIIKNRENRGIGYSRNVGLRQARGKYLFFLDADDELEPYAMERLFNMAEEKQTDIVIFQARRTAENDFLRQQYRRGGKGTMAVSSVKTGGELFVEMMAEECTSVTLWTRFYKRQFLCEGAVEFREKRCNEDVPFCLMTLLLAERCIYIPEVYYTYYQRGASLVTIGFRAEDFEGRLMTYCDLLKFWLWHKEGYSSALNAALDIYLSGIYRVLVNDYAGSSFAENLLFADPFENHIYKCFQMEKSALTQQQLQQLAQYSHLIVYGAGKVAGRVLEELPADKLLGIAVSDAENNPQERYGYPVRRLEEYRGYRETAMVIVAVTEKYQKDIKKKLAQEQFPNVICVI